MKKTMSILAIASLVTFVGVPTSMSMARAKKADEGKKAECCSEDASKCCGAEAKKEKKCCGEDASKCCGAEKECAKKECPSEKM